MLYKIKDNYYILVENRYVKVDFVTKNGTVEIVSDNNDFIEKDKNIVATSVSFNDDFKKNIMRNKSKTYFAEDEDSKGIGMYSSKRKRK